MASKKILYRVLMFGAAVVLYSAAGMVLAAFGAEMPKSEVPKPISGQQVHFPDGTWSAVPQPGPDGKVRQCVMLAPRSRAGNIDTAFGVIISTGSGLTLSVTDDKVPPESVLDDEGEIILDGKSFPAVAFNVGGNAIAFHPGDAAGVLDALKKTEQVQLRSDGVGIDTGPIMLALHDDASSWLSQCGTRFKIALDTPSDPNAPALPTPRPHSPEIRTQASPAGIDDRQEIGGWDASEPRGDDGRVQGCMILAHYTLGGQNGRNVTVGGQDGRVIATYLMVTRTKGLIMLLKDSGLDMPVGAGTPLHATLKIGDRPFSGFSTEVEGHDEIAIFPTHGAALASAFGDGAMAQFDAVKVETMTFPVVAGVVPWLRACARRWGFSLESNAKG